MTHPNHETGERFIREWKKWLERPTRWNASQAAARISAAIQGEAPARHPWWLAFAAAAFLFAVGISLFLAVREPQRIPQQAVVRQSDHPLGSGEVLIWLDERTPLYMTFQPPEASVGSGGKK